MQLNESFKHAFLISDMYGLDQTQTELLGNVIARAGFGLVLVTANRRITYANNTAEILMNARLGLRREHNCILVADPGILRKLQSLIAPASRSTSQPGEGSSLILRDEEGKPTLVLHVVSLGAHADLYLGKDPPVAGLVLVDCRQETTDRINSFADLFALTSAEARVLSQLISGRGLAKAAVHLRIAESTVRCHLTHIMEKTGTHRQAELVKVFYEVTLPWRGDHGISGSTRSGVADDNAAGRYALSVQP